MEHYKQTEAWLYKLNSLKVYVEKLKDEYAELEEIAEGKAVEYDQDKLCETYAFVSATENIALEMWKKATKIKHLNNRIAVLEKAMEILNNTEKQILKLKYFENQPWFNIAYQVQYSESHCKRIRNRAIRKLSIALFGDPEDDTNMIRSLQKTGV